MSSTRRGGLGKGLGALLSSSPGAETESRTRPEVEQQVEQQEEQPDEVLTAPAAPTARSAERVAPVTVGGVRLIEVDPTTLERNPRQPRDVFDEEEIDQLATSLLDVGMLQPLVVRPISGDRYELVAGERRMRAAIAAGLPTVPAIVRATEDADLLKEALVETIHRVQLNPLEEAAAYQQLLDDFGLSQEELASRLGRS